MRLFFFFLTGLITFLGVSQELPPVINFSSSTYDAGNQNWMISQAGNKNIYIANGTGLLEYNGAEWKLYPVPNNTIVRAVKVLGDKIFTGAYMEVGYWKENEYGTLDYTSLIDKFPAKMSDVEQFWHIENSGDIMVFQSFEQLYLDNMSTNEVSIMEVQGTSPIKTLFTVKGKIYFQQEGVGLFIIKNGHPELLIPAELIFTPSYYYIGQFSKFIRPDARRISTASSRSSLLSTSFKNTDGGYATIGMNKTYESIQYNLFVGSDKASFEIPAHSIQTLIY